MCAVALGMLALLAPLAVITSDLPAWLAWPLALLALVNGGRSLHAYVRLPARVFVVPASGAAASCDGRPMQALRVCWRGPLAFVDWQSAAGGRRQRCVFWPDVLDGCMRRELRLAMRRREAVLKSASMAG